MLCNLRELIAMAEAQGHGLAAFNVYGYEDGKAVINAAERLNRPVVLMTNKDAVHHMGVRMLAKILCTLAKEAAVPVGVHLDHATELPVIRAAIGEGFSSVMFDGSQLCYEQNTKLTKEVVHMAHEKGVSVEAEIGAVGYSDCSIKFQARYTEPEEARRFSEETGVDALAVAIGTVHRMEIQEANIQFDLLRKIHAEVNTPLVIHGSTGVADSDLTKLIQYGATKINLGTTLRMAFGNTLRRQMEENPNEFDRVKMFGPCMKAVEEKACEKMNIL